MFPPLESRLTTAFKRLQVRRESGHPVVAPTPPPATDGTAGTARSLEQLLPLPITVALIGQFEHARHLDPARVPPDPRDLHVVHLRASEHAIRTRGREVDRAEPRVGAVLDTTHRG